MGIVSAPLVSKSQSTPLGLYCESHSLSSKSALELNGASSSLFPSTLAFISLEDFGFLSSVTGAFVGDYGLVPGYFGQVSVEQHWQPRSMLSK